MNIGDALAGVGRAVHALADVPHGPPWNLDELDDLLPDPARLMPAAVLVGLVPRHEGLQVLLTLRTEDLRHHAGQVSFPGGRIESLDAGPLQAAMRETREETGIPEAKVQPLGWLDPLATITGFRVLPLVAVLSPDIAPIPQPGEVAQVFEVPLAYLLAPHNRRRIEIDFRGRPRHVLEYARHQDGPRIWGATASILKNFTDRLQHAASLQ